MKLSRIKLPLILSIGVMIGIAACVKETYDMSKLSTKVDLRPGVSLPVAFGQITIGDLITTNDTIQMLEDSSLMLSIEMDTLFSMKVAEIITINDEDIGDGIYDNYKIEDFSLDDVHVNKSVGMSELADNLPNTSDGNALRNASGTYFPTINPQSGGTYMGNNSDKFEYTTYSDGDFTINFQNNFADTIDEIEINIIDDHSINGIFPNFEKFTFYNIPPGGSQSDSKPLDGVTMYDPISFQITNIYIKGETASRTINVSADSIKFITLLENLVLESGKAEINRPEPKDSVSNQVITPQDQKDTELTALTLKTGRIRYNVVNNIGEPIIIDVLFPHTTKVNGDSVNETIIVPPRTTANDTIKLRNTITDLTVGGSTYNEFSIRYKVRVDSTDRYIEFTTADSVLYNFVFENVEYSLIEGYFGKDTTIQNDKLDFDMGGGGILSQFEGGFNLSDPQLSLIYKNSLGIPVEFDLELTADTDEGTVTAGGTRSLPLPSTPGGIEEGALVFDKDDNLDEILTFPMPEQINYDVEALVNPGAKNHNNFITPDGEMYLGMNMEIPLKLSSEGFTFKDTMALDIPIEVTAEYAALSFIFENDFPFNVIIEVFAWDSAGNQFYDDAVISDTLLKAAEVDDNGNVIAPSIFESSVDISSEDFDIIMSSDHLILNASIDTKDAQGVAKDVKIKTNYTVDFTLVVKAQAHITRLPSFGEEGEE
ncbi:hypothetical protein ACFLTE_02395 [Bacteroidota bacterium]